MVEGFGSAVKASEHCLVPAGWLLACMPEPELIQMRDKYEYRGARRSLGSTLPQPLQSWHTVQMFLLRRGNIFFPGWIQVSRRMLDYGPEGGSLQTCTNPWSAHLELCILLPVEGILRSPVWRQEGKLHDAPRRSWDIESCKAVLQSKLRLTRK